MDNLIVSLEGLDVCVIEEWVEREGWLCDRVFEVLYYIFFLFKV